MSDWDDLVRFEMGLRGASRPEAERAVAAALQEWRRKHPSSPGNTPNAPAPISHHPSTTLPDPHPQRQGPPPLRGPQQYVDGPGGQVFEKPVVGPVRPATTLAGTPVYDTIAGVPRSSGNPATSGPGGPAVTGPSGQRLFDRTPPGRRPTWRPTNG